MLSLQTTHELLKYFDSIDAAISLSMMRKRVWDEEALTYLLTEL